MAAEEVRYRNASSIPGLVLGSARFVDYRFEPHYHLDWHVALITDGVQRQFFKGESLLLTPGTVQLMPPGEVHDGIAGEVEAYTMQTFRLSPSLQKDAGEEVAGRHQFPLRSAAVLRDPRLASQLLELHVGLSGASVDPMLDETRVLALFELLFSRLLRPAPQQIAGMLSRPQQRLIKDFMAANLAEKIALDELAALLGMDRFAF